MVGNGYGKQRNVVSAADGDIQRLCAEGACRVNHLEVKPVVHRCASRKGVDSYQIAGCIAPYTGVAVESQGSVETDFGYSGSTDAASTHTKRCGTDQGAVNISSSKRAGQRTT